MAYVGVKPAAITSATEAEIAGDLTVDTNTLKVDSSNNRVGIGSASPEHRLSVFEDSSGNRTEIGIDNLDQRLVLGAFYQGGVGQYSTIQSTNSAESSGEGLVLQPDGGNVGIGTTSPDKLFHLATTDTAKDMIKMSNGTQDFRFGVNNSSAPYLFTYSNHGMRFGTNSSERMRLQANGRFNIHTTGDIGPAALQVRDDTEACIGLQRGGGTSGYFNYVLFANNGNTALIGSIQRVNDASVQYNTTSDARLKENIADMTGAITRVKQLAPKRYSWVNEDLDAADQDGFLAHEAQTVVPMAVSGTQNEVDGDGNPVYMQMDYSKLVPLLTGALKEAIAKIETLETEMTALKARVTALEDA